MPLTFFTDSIGAGVRADLRSTIGETAFVGEGVTLYSTSNFNAVSGSGADQAAVIRGELVSTGTSTVILNGDNSSLSVSDTGSITNLDDLVARRAVSMAADNITLTNAGFISGNVGVQMLGLDTSVINTGTIEATGNVLVGTSMYAVRMRSFDEDAQRINTLENHGTLISNFFAIDAGDEESGGLGAVTTAHITNSGDIYGDIRMGGLNDELHNSGYINGEINMGDDDDLYIGEQGFVETGNNIYLGSGDDEAFGGAGRERVYDGSGDDDVTLGAGNDYVRAGGGADNYDGGEGKDYISYYGSSNGIRIDLRDNEISRSWGSNDTIKDFESASGSRTGDDRMLGTDGSNTLQSYGGDDAIYGRGGDDKLRGGDGEDYFDGGAGADLLWGGDDADVFHFDHGEDKDVIKDFENNVDTIELDNFGLSRNQAFARASESGGNVTFDFGDGDILVVENATIAQLQNDLDIV